MTSTPATYAVMGLDKSGLASVRYLRNKGCRVLAWDDNSAQCERARQLGAEITDLTQGNYECELVLTPGIPHKLPKPHPVAQKFSRIISDIELFARDNPHACIIGITGTNGKSTTTALIHHLLGRAGRKAAIGGNFGVSPLLLEKADYYVIELSSYQLERCPSLRVQVGVMLNLTPDHLDRHGDMAGYAAAKANLFKNGAGVIVHGVDDSYTLSLAHEAMARGWQARPLTIPADGHVEGFDLAALPRLPGAHNWQNALAAIHTCRALGLTDEEIATGLASFPGLDHRQQEVAVGAGIRFINDSKATNADATSKALGCYAPIYWIVGGKPKAGGLNGLEGYMPRIRHAYLIGEAAADFANWLEGKAAYTQCGDLLTATRRAYETACREALPGAVVLLSPACASFDQFSGYEQRGAVFADCARTLTLPAVKEA